MSTIPNSTSVCLVMQRQHTSTSIIQIVCARLTIETNEGAFLCSFTLGKIFGAGLHHVTLSLIQVLQVPHSLTLCQVPATQARQGK